MKTFVNINDRLVAVTTEYLGPPISLRDCDYCAYYTDDQKDGPDCGWGRTADDAIEDLVSSYDEPEPAPSLEDLGGCDHSVGICHCGITRLVETANEVLYPVNQ